MRTTTIIHEIYHVQGMKRPEPVWDHFYYDPTYQWSRRTSRCWSIERIRQQAIDAKHSVIIHWHRYKATCDDTTTHEYYGEQNFE